MAFDLMQGVRSIPLVGNLAGNVLGGPDTSGMEAAAGDAKRFFQEYAPQSYAARQQALQNAMQLFKPGNQMLAQMYGPGAVVPEQQYDQLFQVPQPQASPLPYGQQPPPTTGLTPEQAARYKKSIGQPSGGGGSSLTGFAAGGVR